MVSDVSELHRLLSTRGPVLEAIENGNRRRYEIMEYTGIAKSTAYRALKELRENGLAEKNGREHRLTPYGECALERHRRVEFLSEYGDLLNLIGDEMKHEALLNAEVVRSEPHAPLKPVQKLEEVAEEGDRIRGLAPVFMERYVEFANELLRNGVDAEFVMEKGTADEVTGGHDEKFEKNLRLGADLYITNRRIPCGLLLTESRVCFVAYDDSSVEGCVVADGAHGYAEGLYADYRHSADMLSSA